MRMLTTAALAALIAAAAVVTAGAQQNMAHVHMGHVLTGWQDTPDGKGLLPTALDEAGIAETHAGFAVSRPDDLDWMKLHASHVLHAIDPAAEPNGPGLGFGVAKAASGVSAHIGFAAESDAASDNVKLHATHVATSAGNVAGWAAEIVDLVGQVRAASEPGAAAPLVERIHVLTLAILNGIDANGDGSVGWQQNEGGLAQADQHMGFMRAGEGI